MQGKLSLGVKAHRAGGFPHPRVRGKPKNTEKDFEKMRITPACAGKTRQSAQRVAVGSDPPCVCGENLHHIHIWVICIMERREAYQ